MSQRARRAFDRVREQLRLATTTLVVAGDVMREQRRAHRDDLGRMAELVCQLLEAEETTDQLRASLARMTGRYADALHELERLRAEQAPAEELEDWSDWSVGHGAVSG
ncbi:MAG: hypothetical protein ACEQSX_12520 [Baekduiaceae bacterium]